LALTLVVGLVLLAAGVASDLAEALGVATKQRLTVERGLVADLFAAYNPLGIPRAVVDSMCF
jgi:hypothetical protein